MNIDWYAFARNMHSEQVIFDHIWSHCDLNLRPFDLDSSSVRLCPQMYLNVNLVKIPKGGS